MFRKNPWGSPRSLKPTAHLTKNVVAQTAIQLPGVLQGLHKPKLYYFRGCKRNGLSLVIKS